MEYRPLGRTGVTVSQLCLGAMMFAPSATLTTTTTQSRSSIRHWTHEINFIDTADGYSCRRGQKRSWARPWPAGDATTWCSPSSSAFLSTRNPIIAAPHGGGSPKRSRAHCAGFRPTGSISTRWAFLIRITDIDEVHLRVLSDLVRAGKIRSVGTSKVPASEIVEGQWTGDLRGHERFRTEQPPYSLLTRAIEYDVLPTCLRHGMGVLSYSPLAGRRLAVGQVPQGPGGRRGWVRAPPPRAQRLCRGL